MGKEDTEKDADTMVGRILKAKLWPAEEGGQVSDYIAGMVMRLESDRIPPQWKKNVQDIEGEVLCGTCRVPHRAAIH